MPKKVFVKKRNDSELASSSLKSNLVGARHCVYLLPKTIDRRENGNDIEGK